MDYVEGRQILQTASLHNYTIMDSESKDGTIHHRVTVIQIFIGVLTQEKKDHHLKESLRMYLGVSPIESGGRGKFKAYTMQLKTLVQLYSILGIFITVD